MYDFLIYSLKAAACLAVFYLFYKLLLSRETFHRVNRVVLLAVMAASFILPLCIITVYREAPVQEQPQAYDPAMVMQLIEAGLIDADAFTQGDTAMPEKDAWKTILTVIFIIGAAVALSFVAVSVLRVIGVIRTGEKEPLGRRTVLVKKKEQIVPFSWVKYIVVSNSDLIRNGEQIISHEKAHIDLRHSFDLMLADIFCCLQWFNPAVWLLRRELTAIHEYEADRAVLAAGADPKEYQMLLIKKAVGAGRYSIANSLNHSKLKNRITMMLQKKSSPAARAKILLLLPMVCLALTAFAQTEYVAAEDKINEKETIFPTDGYSVADTVIVSGSGIEINDETSGDAYKADNVRIKVPHVKVMTVNGPIELENSTMVMEDGTRVEIKRGAVHPANSSVTSGGRPEQRARERVVVINGRPAGAVADSSRTNVTIKSFPAATGEIMDFTINMENGLWHGKADSVIYSFSLEDISELIEGEDALKLRIDELRNNPDFNWEASDSVRKEIMRYRFEFDGDNFGLDEEAVEGLKNMAIRMKVRRNDSVKMREKIKDPRVQAYNFRIEGENRREEIKEIMEREGIGLEEYMSKYGTKLKPDSIRLKSGSDSRRITVYLNDSDGEDSERATLYGRAGSVKSRVMPGNKMREKMNIEIDRRGKVKVEGRQVKPEELPNVVAEIAAGSGKSVTDYVYNITASPKTKLGSIDKVKGELRGMGVPVKINDPVQ